MSEKVSERTIDLKDWSKLRDKDRHALFCIAYRLITRPRERRDTALWRISNSLRMPNAHLTKLFKQYITITKPVISICQ